ncbi:hypothetical protein [Chryseobacterium sp.]|jgi:UDP-N-acetylglucosamine enolpyruvyl transferase|uniref:hypothetical protein n=1 Tax=Chryseobacterium sp. TaxID=1871047 RepID=UPI00284C2303|nr:hypothetical protein [Chryseobacterium sp.]MDR3024054.1 hypothetical protein [Chryseobacterium sp.]
MKRIIFMLLLTTSAMSFAKTEEPKVKTEESKVETVLVAKKNFKDEKAEIKISKKLKQAMNLEGCLAVAFTIIAVDPPGGTAMIGACLETYSK